MSIAPKCLLVILACYVYTLDAKCSSGFSESAASYLQKFTRKNECCITRMALFDCSIIWKLFATTDFISCDPCMKSEEPIKIEDEEEKKPSNITKRK